MQQTIPRIADKKKRIISMKLGFRELRHNWKKYLLIEIIVFLMMFMVLFLSGLVKGLGRAVSSGIENMQADHFILKEDSEKLITLSSLSKEQYEEIQNEYQDKATPLDIQRMYFQKNKDAEKENVTYFAIDPDSFLNPDVYEGKALSSKEDQVVLDDDFASDGIRVGDTIIDTASGIELKVSGFTKDAMYGHTSIAYISTDTYQKIMKAVNPAYQETVHAAVVQGNVKAKIDGTDQYTKAEIIQAIPGYQAEQMTITMIEWLLVVITALVIGIFFFVINLQKEKEFGVLKAIGTGMGSLVGQIVSQVCFIAVFGALLASCLVLAMSAVLPVTMPFYLQASQAVIVLAAFVLISILGSLATVIRVAKIDPARIIGGDFQ